MTQETAKTTETGKFHEEFKALPLDQKFSNLLELEMTTLSEAMKYVADSSMKILEKVGDAISDFGAKVETEAKKATEANAAEPATSPDNDDKSEERTERKPATPEGE